MRRMSFGVALGAVVAAGAIGGAHAQSAPAPAPAAPPATAPGTLPPGPGHDLTVRTCSGCHAPEIAAQQRLAPKAWKDLVDTMASRGADATDAELDQITDYLARSFPDKPAAAPARR